MINGHYFYNQQTQLPEGQPVESAVYAESSESEYYEITPIDTIVWGKKK